MKTKARWVLLFAGTSLFGALPGGDATQEPNSEGAAAKAFKKLEAEWAAAVESNDPKRIERFFAPHFVFVGAGGVLQDRAQHLEDFASKRLKVESVTLGDMVIHVYDKAAVVSSRVMVNGKYGDRDISGPYQFTDTWVNQGGRWLAAARQQTVVAKPKSPGAQLKETLEKTQLMMKHVLSRTNPYTPPRLVSVKAKKGEVTVPLNVQFAWVEVERPVEKGGTIVTVKDKLRVRTYDGSMTVPAIRVVPGDLLKVTLNNRIPKTEFDRPSIMNRPNGFNITNLHTHGLHVSPEGRSDNVFLEVGPEESLELCYDIPKTHKPGTHWFHAHRHGSTALQLCSGMAGALIVEPGSEKSLDDIPEIKAVMDRKAELEKILVFQQLLYSLHPQRTKDHKIEEVGEVTVEDVYKDNPDPLRITLINGQYAPLIHMKPGEVQRWRCVHAGIDSELNLVVTKNPLKPGKAPEDFWDICEIAADGLPLYETSTGKNLLLYPGYRSDVLIKAPLKVPDKGEDYILTQMPVPPAKAFRKASRTTVPIPLARIHVEGKPNPMNLPDPKAIGKYAPAPIEEEELFNRKPWQLTFRVQGLSFTINDQEFDRDRAGVCPRLGTAEEWALVAGNDRHPFHIHVNPFMVVQKNEKGEVSSRVWRDTIFFTEDDPAPTFIRMRFEDFAGKTVLHCHNLAHEDQGMMMTAHIAGKDTFKSRCPAKPGGIGLLALPAKAPAWSLPDADNRTHRSSDRAGQKHVLIFYRGLGCDHCRRQLNALAKARAALADARWTVVAISPDACDAMREVLAADDSVRSFPFLLLSDPSLEVFRRYGCHDGRALHGTFLTDADGTVRWQHVGDEPFMDIEELLSRCRAVASNNPRPGP